MATMEFDHLDVRPLLGRGEEPFGAIMEAKARLRQGRGLRLVAPFEPFPLYGMFEAEGFRIHATLVGEGEWRIDFEPPGMSGEPDETRSSGGEELDLRALEPPAPLQKGLEAVRRLGRGRTLILHTRFRPVHLFEQIEGGGFDYDSEETSANHWTTHIWRVEEA